MAIMYEQLKLDQEQQNEIVSYVKETAQEYTDRLRSRMNLYMDIYKAYSTFKLEKKAKRQTTFKVNKAHEVVNKVLPRVISRPPKWLVSVKTSERDKEQGVDMSPDMNNKLREYSQAIQDYLDSTFKKGDLLEVLRLFAKSGIIYGNSFAKICYRYDINRQFKADEIEIYDEETGEVVGYDSEYSVDEDVVDEFATIEVKSRDDILYDPRYVRLEDMPCLIDQTKNVRLSHFTKNEKKYKNIDKLIDVCMTEYDNPESYAERIHAITGINNVTKKVSSKNLELQTYYGYYEIEKDDGREEKLYEFQVVNGLVLVCAKEISMIPFEDFKCFEDTETHFATGFVEPIIGLQKELNFKKNAASHYVNQSLNRTWVWSPNSGIDPRKLNSAPGNIIPTNKTATEAMNNLVEIPHRQLPSDYFQEQNDIERQIQGSTFTIDVSTPRSQQGLTQTATGIRIKAYETNSVMEEIKRHFEESMSRLAYKFLQYTFENLEGNITIKKLGKEGYRQINKEAMRDALRRYEIRMEAGSSSFDTIEERRSDAIAKWNLSVNAAQTGVPVNLDKVWKEVMDTFEGTNSDELLKPINPMQQMQQPGAGGGGVDMDTQEEDPSAEKVRQISGGYPVQ